MVYKFLFFWVIVTSSLYGQDCKGVSKKSHKKDGVTVFVAHPKGHSKDPNELTLLVARKLVSGTDTLYDIILFELIDRKPDKANLKGVNLIFEDGSQIQRPDQDIEVTKMKPALMLKAQYQLKPEEVVQLSQKTLTKVRLVTKEYSLNPKMAQSFQQKAGCLLQSF